jgi:ribokinase
MIVVFGSVNIDLVVPVERLPRPGETVLGPHYTLVPGGKGANQALAAARAGSAVRMIGRVGRDGFADLALADLKAASIDLSAMERDALPTGCALIPVDRAGGSCAAQDRSQIAGILNGV